MDDNKINEYEQNEVTIASLNKIENSDTVEVQTLELPVLKEDQELLLPVASFKKVFKSDLNIPQIALDKIKKLGGSLFVMILGIIRYCKDSCIFLLKSDESLGRVYRYPFMSQVGYAILSSIVTSLIPVIFVSQKMINHTKVFKEIQIAPALWKLWIISFVVVLMIKILLGFMIPIIEYLTNKHHIPYISVIKTLNIQSVSMNLFIVLVIIMNLLGSKILWVIILSILIFIYGIIISYFFYLKTCKKYRLIRNETSAYTMLTTLTFMILFSVGAYVIYICNSSLLQIVLKVFLK